MRGKTYKIDLLPEDFFNSWFMNNINCALNKAMRRYFKKEFCTCGERWADIWKSGPYARGKEQKFEIINHFTEKDYEFVKEQYQDPHHDTIYYVTLKEV